MSMQKIAVLGGGAWGTALALTCARAGRDVTLWEHDPANAESLASKRESTFLPGVKLDPSVKVTRDLAEAAHADAILLVVPAQAVRAVVKALAPSLGPSTPLIACAKGIERSSGKLVNEADLVAALQAGRIAGAGLDVFVDEPHVPPALLAMPNTTLQAHRASATWETRTAMGEMVLASLAQALAGQRPDNSLST